MFNNLQGQTLLEAKSLCPYRLLDRLIKVQLTRFKKNRTFLKLSNIKQQTCK